MAQRFIFVDLSNQSTHYFRVTPDGKFSFGTHHPLDSLDTTPYQQVGSGITVLLDSLNTSRKCSAADPLKWMVCKVSFHPYHAIYKILPVFSQRVNPVTQEIVSTKKGFIIDTQYAHAEASSAKQPSSAAAESAIPAAAQPGGSLYDKKGKLLYRGEMKNGVPHGYGTGYYANGKVGHVGMFKGGKIVQ